MISMKRALSAVAVSASVALSGAIVAAPMAQATVDNASTASQTLVAAKAKKASKPKIVQQPRSASIRGKAKATFKVKASGSALKYQWYIKRSGSKKFTSVKTATRSSWTTAKQPNRSTTAKVRVVVRNSSGRVTSKTANLKVTAWKKPVIGSSKATRVNHAKGTVFTVAGRNLSGAKVTASKMNGSKLSIRLVGRNASKLKFRVGRNDVVDFNKITVSNPAGKSSTVVLLMRKVSTKDHKAVVQQMRELNTAVKDAYGYWEDELVVGVRYALTSATNNTKRWEPVDASASQVITNAALAEIAVYDDDYTQDDVDFYYTEFLDWWEALRVYMKI